MRWVWLLALATLALGGLPRRAARRRPTPSPPTPRPRTDERRRRPAPAPAPSAKLAQIFTADILGSANVAHLETITGPAFRTDGADR